MLTGDDLSSMNANASFKLKRRWEGWASLILVILATYLLKKKISVKLSSNFRPNLWLANIPSTTCWCFYVRTDLPVNLAFGR